MQNTFSKLIAEYKAQEAERKLQAKIDRGEKAINQGKGISQMVGETNEEFFEQLCTVVVFSPNAQKDLISIKKKAPNSDNSDVCECQSHLIRHYNRVR